MPSKRSASLFFKSIAFAAVAALVPTGLASASDSKLTPQPQVFTTKSVGVQMFEWTWNSLAKECTTNLGPAGYDWVEVSPPQEHIVGSEWWIHYQPVSYKLESKLGTRAEFANMVDTCEKAGVAIIVDAVINHMAASATAVRAEMRNRGEEAKAGRSTVRGLQNQSMQACCAPILYTTSPAS